jgi:hypothetical protein
MDKVAVVDYGSQFTQLIARRIREAGIYSEIFPPTAPLDRILTHQAVILSGGPNSVYDEGAPLPPPRSSRRAFPSWASATACRRWLSCWAARSSRVLIGSTDGPR